jgi:hypothetical protein
MKINSTLVDQICLTVKKEAKHASSQTEGQAFNVYALDDLTVTFHQDDREFYGLIFEVLYKNFIVLPDYTVLMEDFEKKQEPVVVRDVAMIQMLNKFLSWRLDLLHLLGSSNESVSSH